MLYSHMSVWREIGERRGERTFVLVVLAEQAGEEIRPAACDMHEGPLFAEGEPRCDSEREADGFDEKHPRAEERVKHITT